jgi:hypothetical protein
MRKATVSPELLDMAHDPSHHIVALPDDSAAAYTAALAKDNLFRRYATTIRVPSNGEKIVTTDTPVDAAWVDENGAIPEANLNATYLGLDMHKLACISMLDSNFVYDTGFDIKSYLTRDFARIFGKAEEDGFINGNGVNAPRGILHPTDGAEVGVTAASATVIAFDEVNRLFFSLKPEYRMNAIWTMSDETALALRDLKDSTSNYLWRGTADTLLGRPVVISNHMPSAASGSKPIAFGDFEVVQKIRDGRRRVTPMGEMPILSGMLFCADCGAKLYQVRHRGWEHDKEHFVCATYRKIKGGCSSHQIRNVVVEELLLDGIRQVTAFAREHEGEFVQMVTSKTKTELDKSLRDSKRELEQSQARIAKLDEIIQRLYEDNLSGKISDERFAKMTANYETEQHTLESRVVELKGTMTAEHDSALNVDHFLALVRKYTDIQELTAEMIREFVEKVLVYKVERIDGRRVQRIKIVWNCIGEFTPPAVTEQEKSA